jgi:DNA-binding GntR family transcriptional regulator
MPAQETAWLGRIESARSELRRESAAETVAELLRDQIIDGLLTPGVRVPERELCAAVGASRNTVREAFRLLIKDRLLEQQFNSGFFVRRLTADDLADVYRVRRILECAGVRNAKAAPAEAIAALDAAVTEGERAAGDGAWQQVGTADIHFHEAVGALCGSPRVDETMRTLLAELRLVFHVMGPRREFHEPYLARNRVLTGMMARGEIEAAERELLSYLDDAEAQLTKAYRQGDT